MRRDVDDALGWADKHRRETIGLVIDDETVTPISVEELTANRDVACWGCISYCASGDYKAQGTAQVEGWPESWTVMQWAKSSEAVHQLFAAQYQEKIAEFTRRRDDPYHALKVALKEHDWWSDMSDDHRVYQRGRASYARLLDLAGKLPRVDAEALWSEFGNPEFKFPL